MSTLSTFDLPGIRLYHEGIRSEPSATDAPIIVHRPLTPANPDEWSPSDFWGFFKSILSDLDHYAWLFDGGNAFVWPWNDEAMRRRLDALLAAARITEDGDCLATVPRFLADTAVYIRDDWNSLYGFATPPSNLPLYRGLCQRGDSFWSFLPTVDVFFDNYDGIYWAVFTPHTSLLDRVKNALRTDARIHIIDTSVRDTLAVHEREEQEWRAVERDRMRQKALHKRARRSKRRSGPSVGS